MSNSFISLQDQIVDSFDKGIEYLRTFFSQNNSEVFTSFTTQKAFWFIIILAAVLRTWQLDSKMIFFGDIGRDLIVADYMISDGKIPLLGIPSSVPRFRQGPLMIWFMASIMFFFGNDPIILGYAVALLGVLTVALTYLLVEKTVSTQVAQVASLWMATSPLAVAHSRMAYHISPIPFFTLLYLWSLLRLHHKKKGSLFLAVLCWGILFQFELSLALLIVAIPLILIRNKFSFSFHNVLPGLIGFILGLLPQILYDLQNRFEHLGGFMVWAGYRVVALSGFDGKHTVNSSRIATTGEQFSLYWTRIASVDQPILFILLMIFVLLSAMFAWKKRHSLPELIWINWMLFVLLTVSYVIHGKPSEAYFPPYIVFFSIIIGYLILQAPKKFLSGLLAVVGVWATINTISIFQNNFFVSPSPTAFTYGTSYGEIKEVAQTIEYLSNQQPFTLVSTSPGSEFPSYLDHYRFILNSHRRNEQITERELTIAIEQLDTELLSYPGAKIIHFPNTILVQFNP